MTKLWRKFVALVARFTNWLSPSLWRWLQVQELRFLMWRRPDIIEQEIKSNAAEMARGSHRPDLQEHFEKMGRHGFYVHFLALIQNRISLLSVSPIKSRLFTLCSKQ